MEAMREEGQVSPDEHLDRIIAKCREMIELGAARTRGMWIPFPAIPGSVACPVGTRVMRYAKGAIADTYFGEKQGSPSHAEAKANAPVSDGFGSRA